MSEKKFEIGTRIPFAGYVVSSEGVQADPAKTKAISDFPRPECVKDVRSFLGLANQLGGFVDDLAMVTGPLRALLKKDSAWLWTPVQEEAFRKCKEVLVSPKVLAYFDPKLPMTVLCDASKLHGLGFALIQTDVKGNTRLIQCGS